MCAIYLLSREGAIDQSVYERNAQSGAILLLWWWTVWQGNSQGTNRVSHSWHMVQYFPNRAHCDNVRMSDTGWASHLLNTEWAVDGRVVPLHSYKIKTANTINSDVLSAQAFQMHTFMKWYGTYLRIRCHPLATRCARFLWAWFVSKWPVKPSNAKCDGSFMQMIFMNM